MSETPSTVPALPAGTVHLWWQAGGPARPRDRRQRVDALLRRVLAGYVGLPAAALRFGRESRGRPFLLGPAGEPRGPQFNLSDTTGGTVVAVSADLRVGVDLERGDRRPSHRALAPRWFSAAEAGALAALPEEPARRAFLALWTAKEAACKATGTGIYGRLHQWVFAAAEGEPRLQAAPAEAGDPAQWSFRRLQPAADYTAVVACRGALREVRVLAPLPD